MINDDLQRQSRQPLTDSHADAGDRNASIDDEAIAELARRNPAEFAPLYRHYVRPIFGYCLLRLGDREQAEDATSQTFEQALAALPRYRSQSFRGWLFRIAHNVVVDYQRSRVNLPIDRAFHVTDNEASPEESALMADEKQQLRELLAHLSDDQREVIELELAGVQGAEISEILGRRPGAIRALRFRAYARLRAVLTNGVDQ